MEWMRNDIERLVLVALLHPLRDLAARAWGDKAPEWVEQILKQVETYCGAKQWNALVKRSVQLALGSKETHPQTAISGFHLPLVSIFSGLSPGHTKYHAPTHVGYFSPSVLIEEPVYPEICISQ